MNTIITKDTTDKSFQSLYDQEMNRAQSLLSHKYKYGMRNIELSRRFLQDVNMASGSTN